uniref:WGS project CAEQ00000000 data, annotated contig 1735 n=1 Tax=Trypanosoma congolense (strain IL3000) TaxID=1068625 RepID=F9W8G1_TRYCI|nr:unnamed protein product [Trypanosoma congolense IL3000]
MGRKVTDRPRLAFLAAMRTERRPARAGRKSRTLGKSAAARKRRSARRGLAATAHQSPCLGRGMSTVMRTLRPLPRCPIQIQEPHRLLCPPHVLLHRPRLCRLSALRRVGKIVAVLGRFGISQAVQELHQPPLSWLSDHGVFLRARKQRLRRRCWRYLTSACPQRGSMRILKKFSRAVVK